MDPVLASARAACAANTAPYARRRLVERTPAAAVEVQRTQRPFGGEQAEGQHALDARTQGERGERRPLTGQRTEIVGAEGRALADGIDARTLADVELHGLDLPDELARPAAQQDPVTLDEQDAGAVAAVDGLDGEVDDPLQRGGDGRFGGERTGDVGDGRGRWSTFRVVPGGVWIAAHWPGLNSGAGSRAVRRRRRAVFVTLRE